MHINKKDQEYMSWIKELAKKWTNDIYFYDEEEAEKIYRFSSKLRNDRGESKNFKLLKFQFEIITEILCVKRKKDSLRKHREAHINIPRKNGKSFIIAIIVTYLYFCQKNIFGALFVLTANTTKQATQLFNTILNFIKKNKTLKKYCKITESTRTIVRKDNENTLMVLSSDASNADSFNVYCACLDEVHEAKDDKMYGKLRTGQGTWSEPLLITITTASSGEDAANLEMQLYTLSKKLESESKDKDPAFYFKIYEAIKGCDIMDRTEWYKSNPALGVFRQLEDLENLAKKAVLMPLQENMFRRMYLNQHVALDSEKGAINMDLWRECIQDIDLKALEGCSCWGGLDLSSKNDVTAFILIFYDELKEKFIIVPYLFTPKDTIFERENKDKNPYSTWVKNKEMVALEGKYINFERLLDFMMELDQNFKIEMIGFDRWGSQTILNRLENKWDIVALGQGTGTMTTIINDFENLLIDGRLIIARNSAFDFMAKNCIAVETDAGVKYSKKKSKFKIDGIIAMLMALLLAIEANTDNTISVSDSLDSCSW